MSATPRSARRHAAVTGHAHTRRPPAHGAAASSPLSLIDLLERVDLKILLGKDALEFRILGFQAAQTLDVGRLQATEMASPVVNCLLADLVLFRDLRDRRLVGLPQDRDARASLHAIDRCFMQTRRRLSLLERPIKSASSEGRTWYGYSPYNPAVVVKLLLILRIVCNHVLEGAATARHPRCGRASRRGKTSSRTSLLR